MSDLDLFSKYEIHEVNGDTVSKQTYDAIAKLQSKLDCAVKALEEFFEYYDDKGKSSAEFEELAKEWVKRARLALEEIKG